MKKQILSIILVAAFMQLSKAQTQPCFNTPITFGTSSFHGSNGITSADFNSDGKPDLAVVDNNSIYVFQNSGTGAFGSSVNYQVVGSHQFQDITSADFNGDGKPDIAVINNLGYEKGKVYVFLNTGSGTFGTSVSYDVEYHPYNIISADFNGDGKPDLAVANWGGSNVSVLLNTGTGTFFAAITSAWVTNYITSADFNGDGKPDIAATSFHDKDLKVLMNAGTVTFGVPSAYPLGNYPGPITTADFNGDSKPDLAVNTNSELKIFLNDGTGNFQNASNYPGGVISDLTTGDFNGDGKPDLVTSGCEVYLNDGTGNFKPKVSFNGSGRCVTIADFNGDGKQDIATSSNFNGNVILNCPAPIPPSADFSNLPTSLCLGSHVDAIPNISGTPPQTNYLPNPLVSPQVDTAIAVCKNNHSVFVLFAGDSVRRYDSAGNYQFTYPFMPLGSHAIAADNNNRLFVVGPDNLNPAISQISCYNASGNMDFTFWNSSPTTDNYILNYIAGIAVGPDNKLYAADTLADIKVLTTDGSSLLSSIPTPSNSQYSLYKPMSICFGKGGQMLVADAGKGNILARNTTDNNFYPVFTKIDTTWQPISVDVDTMRNNLYFATRNVPHRVIMGNATNLFGDTLCIYDTLSSHVTFASPNSLAVVNQNTWPNLWVSDNKSTTLNRVNEFTYQIAPALPPGLTFHLLGGITGTPTTTFPLTTYTVTVSNSLGTTTTLINLAVDPPGPVSNSAGVHTSSANLTDGLTLRLFDANNCAKMLEIEDKVGGGMPGAVTVTQTVTPTISVFNADAFVNRVTKISAQDPYDSAGIKIYYTYLDIQHYNQSLGSTVLSNDTVGGTMKVSVLQMHESPPESGHLIPIKHGPITANWSNTDHHWVVDFKVSKFSDFYMGDTLSIDAFNCINSHADTITTVGNYYIWHGDTLMSSGSYADTLVNKTGCDSVCMLNLTINNTTGISTPLLNNSTNIYPNPSTGIVAIDVNNPNIELSNIRITNLVGQVVYTSNDNNRNRQIDLSNMAKGYYFVTLTSKNEVVNKKILIE